MSGLVGLWQLDGRPVELGVLGRMSAAIRHRGSDGEGRRVVGSVGFACQHRWITPEELGERQPLVGAGGAVMLMLDGRLDNRDELVSALGVPATASDAAFALAAYEAWGEGFAARLNGDFVVAVFDGARRRLLLARDAIGVRPLYYHWGARLFAFASEIKALLAHPDIPCEPDDEGIADYLLVSSRPIDRQEVTCFAGIRALVPAHLAVVTPEGVTTRRYWDFDPARAIRLRSFEEYVEAFRAHFARAVARRLRAAHPVAIAVSGGLDSSSVFCQAVQLWRSGQAPAPGVRGFFYFVAEEPAADERAYVAALEQELGLGVEQFPIDDLAGLVDGLDERVTAAEAPSVDFLWGATCELHRRAAAGGGRVLLSGTWGDQVLFSPAYLVDLLRAGAWATLRQHRRAYVEWLGLDEARLRWGQFLLELARWATPRALAPMLKGLRRRLLGSARSKDGWATPFHQRALRFADRLAIPDRRFRSVHGRAIYVQVRAKYHVHCLESENKAAARHGLEVAYPMLDRDLVAWLLAVPGEVQTWQGVPRGLLREAMRGVVPEAIRRRRSKGDYSRVVNRGVARDLSVVAQTLGPASRAVRCGYLDPEWLPATLARLAAGLEAEDCVDSWRLGDLYGLELWLQIYFHGFEAAAVRPSSVCAVPPRPFPPESQSQTPMARRAP